MTTNTPARIGPAILSHAHVLDHLRQGWEAEHAHILTEAKAQLREAVRSEFCRAFNVVRDENRDDDGGGSITLRFPEGWTEDEATEFAERCLDIDCSYHYGGPGRYFQSGGVGTNTDGTVTLSMRWGLDI